MGAPWSAAAVPQLPKRLLSPASFKEEGLNPESKLVFANGEMEPVGCSLVDV